MEVVGKKVPLHVKIKKIKASMMTSLLTWSELALIWMSMSITWCCYGSNQTSLNPNPILHIRTVVYHSLTGDINFVLLLA
jgi:hypothetical protein